MNIKVKITHVCFFFILFFLLLNIKSYAGTQSWNSLDYNVTVNSDGSMDVVETWDINISETNTLFKDFDIDYEKYSGITDVKVSQVKSSNEEIYLQQIYQEQYHVDTDCYYALPISSSKYEIAWNVGLDNSSSTRTYKLYYTIRDAVKIYNDCTELYWMFLGTDNEISGKNITGTIKLPQRVSDIEKLRIWAHGPLDGNIEKLSNNTVSFYVPSLSSNTMVEIRVVTEENIYEESDNLYYENKLSSILEEEQTWANKANMQRVFYKGVFIFILIIFFAIILIFYKKIKKYMKEGKELKEKYSFNITPIEYFREIPNEEKATPARAAYLKGLKNVKYSLSSDFSKIFSATILDLSIKGLISFEPINDKDFKIIINPNSIQLPEDEKYTYNLLVEACRKTDISRNYLTSKELLKYSKKNYEDFYYARTKFEVNAENYEKACENIDLEKQGIVDKLENKSVIYLFVMIMCIVLGIIATVFALTISLKCMLLLLVFVLPVICESIAMVVVINKIISSISILSEKGYEEQQKWLGLEKYMKEYSLLKEKEVFDVILWEKFLVYATAFGISKQVIKQLKTAYPDAFINQDNGYPNYGYWYLISDSRFGENVFDNLNDVLEKSYTSALNAYNIANSDYSSGSGGGGGFSSGGGGRRRSAEAVADANKKYVKMFLPLNWKYVTIIYSVNNTKGKKNEFIK